VKPSRKNTPREAEATKDWRSPNPSATVSVANYKIGLNSAAF
jgi:hypothetical protein